MPTFGNEVFRAVKYCFNCIWVIYKKLLVRPKKCKILKILVLNVRFRLWASLYIWNLSIIYYIPMLLTFLHNVSFLTKSITTSNTSWGKTLTKYWECPKRGRGIPGFGILLTKSLYDCQAHIHTIFPIPTTTKISNAVTYKGLIIPRFRNLEKAATFFKLYLNWILVTCWAFEVKIFANFSIK